MYKRQTNTYEKFIQQLFAQKNVDSCIYAYLQASREVLLAIPGATPALVDNYIAQRAEALAAKLAPPPFPLSGFQAPEINLWRIRAEATMADGVKFVRVAVLRTGDQRRLLMVLEWQDGTDRVLSAAADAQNEVRTDATRTQ